VSIKVEGKNISIKNKKVSIEEAIDSSAVKK
jgi:hypothetical protein